MLTPAERAALPNPGHSVEISLALNPRVPELTEGAFASLAADTILADKFVLITPGAATSAPLPSDAILNGVAPTTFDALSAEVATSLATLRGVISGLSNGGARTIFQDLPGLMEQIGTTLTQAQGLLKNADQLVGEGIQVIGRGDVLISDTSRVVTRVGTMVDDTAPTLEKLITDLQAAAATLDRFAVEAEKLIRDNAGPVNRTTVQLERAITDLRITSAHTKTLAESLVRRPQQIIWGTRRESNQVLSEQEILAD
jgi:ABC-type transporter Mla subunit MlaD